MVIDATIIQINCANIWLLRFLDGFGESLAVAAIQSVSRQNQIATDDFARDRQSNLLRLVDLLVIDEHRMQLEQLLKAFPCHITADFSELEHSNQLLYLIEQKFTLFLPLLRVFQTVCPVCVRLDQPREHSNVDVHLR